MNRNLLELIGKTERKELGDEIPIIIFRAFRIYSGEYLKDIVGEKGTVALFQNAGRELGKSLGEKLKASSLESFLDNVSAFMREEKIGILIVDRANEKGGVLKIDECITCYGFPNIGSRICHFEAGLIGGIFESFTGKKVKVVETKCNANGEGICEVSIEVK